MAGIGFKMQKLFKEDYFSARIRAYSFAGFITAGPWIIIVLTIGFTQWLIGSMGQLDPRVKELFVISISYCFIFSQLIFGTQQLVVTRYISDLFYTQKTERVYAAFLGVSKVILFLAVGVWLIFAWYSPLPFSYKWLLLVLFVVINLIWVLFLFLSAAKYYQPVAYSFFMGGVIAIGLIYLVATWLDLARLEPIAVALWLVGGFTIGMVVTLFILFFALLISFSERGVKGQFAYFQYYARYPSLFWSGFLYQVGLWVSNGVIWFGEGATLLEDTFRFHTVYDSAVFWSFISIIPTMILFVTSIETRFYQRYKAFYGYINEGGSLEQILEAKDKMLIVLQQELESLLRNQALVSLTLLLASGYLADWFGLTQDFLTLFRLTVVGAFSTAVLLVLTLLLLYFEDRQGALLSTSLFAGSNLLLSLVLLPLGWEGYGLSFVISSTVAFVYAAWRLAHYVSEADYYAFTGQGAR